jgi:YesN/AraC family two-component response regulator
VGFSNPFYFSLRFKKQTGENPRGFRRRLLRENR